MKNNKVLIISSLLLSCITVTVFGTPIVKEIKAHFKANLEYNLNENEVLKGKGGLVYEDKVYVPLRDMAELLGVEVDYKDNTIILNEPKKVIIDTPEIVAPKVFSLNGVVTKVDREYLMIKANNKEYLVTTSSNTKFSHKNNKESYQLNDIKIGQLIEINYNGEITSSTYQEILAELIILLEN